jgi:hypothetical protein
MALVVGLAVAGAIAVVISVVRLLGVYQRRVHRRIVSGDYLDVRALTHALPPGEPRASFVVTDLVGPRLFDQDAPVPFDQDAEF